MQGPAAVEFDLVLRRQVLTDLGPAHRDDIAGGVTGHRRCGHLDLALASGQLLCDRGLPQAQVTQGQVRIRAGRRLAAGRKRRRIDGQREVRLVAKDGRAVGSQPVSKIRR